MMCGPVVTQWLSAVLAVAYGSVLLVPGASPISMYPTPNLLGGGACFIQAPMNSMLLASKHALGEPLSGPMRKQLNPLVPGRSVVMLPSFSMRMTAAPLATAGGAADSAAVMYAESESAAFP